MVGTLIHACNVVPLTPKSLFFFTCTFLQLCFCWLETELNLDTDPNPELITDPDPKLQIILDLAGSRSTTIQIFRKHQQYVHIYPTKSTKYSCRKQRHWYVGKETVPTANIYYLRA